MRFGLLKILVQKNINFIWPMLPDVAANRRQLLILICNYKKNTQPVSHIIIIASITVLLIIDFKMKIEAMSSCESTIEHLGKRGIG